MAIPFVHVSIELFEALKVLASQPGYIFQSDHIGLISVTGSLGYMDKVEE